MNHARLCCKRLKATTVGAAVVLPLPQIWGGSATATPTEWPFPNKPSRRPNRFLATLAALALAAVAAVAAGQSPGGPPTGPDSKHVLADPALRQLQPVFGRGVNLGNALDAPKEGDWGVVLKEDYFQKISKAGFDSVRIPVRWSAHAETAAPFALIRNSSTVWTGRSASPSGAGSPRW